MYTAILTLKIEGDKVFTGPNHVANIVIKGAHVETVMIDSTHSETWESMVDSFVQHHAKAYRRAVATHAVLKHNNLISEAVLEVLSFDTIERIARDFDKAADEAGLEEGLDPDLMQEGEGDY